MPFLLFRITRTNWVKISSIDSEAVIENSLQADALSDLKTAFNELEVWFIDDAKSQLNQIISELNKNDKIPPDNIIIDLSTIESLGLILKSKDNSYSIENLSAIKLIELAELIYSVVENP